MISCLVGLVKHEYTSDDRDLCKSVQLKACVSSVIRCLRFSQQGVLIVDRGEGKKVLSFLFPGYGHI